MTTGRDWPAWSDTNDRMIVAEMLKDTESRHWQECLEYVGKRVQKQAKNIPQVLDQWEDIAQDIMILIRRGLPYFQYQSSLKTWLYSIINNYIKDIYRKSKHTEPHISLDYHKGVEHEGSPILRYLYASETVESTILIKEMVVEAMKALEEYLTGHVHSKRNKRILEMVFFERFSCEVAAKVVGCSGPVASYVVRSAREYVRKKLGYPKPQKRRQ